MRSQPGWWTSTTCSSGPSWWAAASTSSPTGPGSSSNCWTSAGSATAWCTCATAPRHEQTAAAAPGRGRRRRPDVGGGGARTWAPPALIRGWLGTVGPQRLARSAEHLPFEHFDMIHATLDGPGVPSRGQPPGDRVQVAGQAVGERGQARQALGADRGDPGREFLAAELGEHLAEGADVAGGRAQFRALLQDRLEPHLVVLGQGGGVAGEPSGVLPHGG